MDSAFDPPPPQTHTHKVNYTLSHFLQKKHLVFLYAEKPVTNFMYITMYILSRFFLQKHLVFINAEKAFQIFKDIVFDPLPK